MEVLIVDPASSGRDLCVALRSYSDVTVTESWQEVPFEIDTADGEISPELELSLESLASKGYDAVVAGSESGVTFANLLATCSSWNPTNRPDSGRVCGWVTFRWKVFARWGRWPVRPNAEA